MGSERGLRRVRLPDVDAVDRGADAFEPALGLVADALLVVQVPLAAGMHGEDHEQRVGRRSGVDRLSPAPKIRATSSGTVKGDAMTLKVVVEGEESEPPEYRLLRG